MELVHSTKSEDGGDTVIILPDVETGAVFSVLDVLYSGQSSATKDDEKFQLIEVLLRLGLEKVARSLTPQLVTASDIRDENLNNLSSLQPQEEIKAPAFAAHSPDILDPETETDIQKLKLKQVYKKPTEVKQSSPLNIVSPEVGKDFLRLTSTPNSRDLFPKEKKTEAEKEKCIQQINAKMKKEFSQLKLKDDRKKKMKAEEAPKYDISIAQNPKSISEKILRSNKRSRDAKESKYDADPKLSVIQPYPLRDDQRVTLNLKKIVPKPPKGKIRLQPGRGNKFASKEPDVVNEAMESTVLNSTTIKDSSSAPPLGYRKGNVGRKTVRVGSLLQFYIFI